MCDCAGGKTSKLKMNKEQKEAKNFQYEHCDLEESNTCLLKYNTSTNKRNCGTPKEGS